MDPTPVHYKTWWLVMVLVIIVLVGVVVSFWGGALRLPFANTAAPISTQGSPSGYIFLNLTAQKPGASTQLYIYNVRAHSFGKASVQTFTPRVSNNGQVIMGSWMTSTSTSAIFEFDANATSSVVFATFGAVMPQLPQHSPNKDLVVFSVPPNNNASSTAFSTPSAWKIYLVSRGGVPYKLVNGMYPSWSPDGSSILYLGDDGLHLVSITATSSDTVVWPVVGGVSTGHMKFTISHNGTRLAWTNPQHGTVSIVTITSWKPAFSIGHETNYQLHAFWPVFSPDGNTLAVEQVDWHDAPQNPTGARLTLIDLTSGTSTTVMDLSAFNQLALFMTAWIAHQ